MENEVGLLERFAMFGFAHWPETKVTEVFLEPTLQSS